MLQGFIVLFSGAMAYVIAPMVGWGLAQVLPRAATDTEARHG
jgi:hypothetical protein